jgi:hypothetical protein
VNWNSNEERERPGNTGKARPMAWSPLYGLPLWVLGGLALLVGGLFWLHVYRSSPPEGQAFLLVLALVGAALAGAILLFWAGLLAYQWRLKRGLVDPRDR